MAEKQALTTTLGARRARRAMRACVVAVACVLGMSACSSGGNRGRSSAAASARSAANGCSGDTLTVGQPQVTVRSGEGAPIPAPQTSSTALACQSDVRVTQSGEANLAFAAPAECHVSPSRPGETAAVRTHDPANALFRFESARVLCSFTKGTPTVACGSNVVAVPADLTQTVTSCESDPEFEVAVFTGSANVTDPAGHARIVTAGNRLQFHFDTNSSSVEPATFTDRDKLIFLAQAAALGFNIATTTTNGTPSTALVPDVTNQTSDAATATLRRNGFSDIRPQIEPSVTVPSGEVTRTQPPAGASVATTTPINVFVSTGPPTVLVPDEAGRSPAAATTDLGNHRLAAIQKEQVDAANVGVVVDQSPAANTPVLAGSTVTIFVGTAPPQTVPPTTTTPIP